MRYQCIQCDQAFDFEPSGADPRNDKPRCPKCLRQHGLRKLDDAPSAAQGGKSRMPWAAWAAIAVCVVAAIGFTTWKLMAARQSGPAGAGPLSADDLRTRARTLAQIEVGELADWLVPNAEVEAFAKHAAGSASSANDKAKAIAAALEARAQHQAFVPWSRLDARDGMPMAPSATLAAIAKDGARLQLYPLELAALSVAALRSLDVEASIAEVYRYPNEKTPLDPSGRLGYFALAVPAADGGKPTLPTLYDVYGARPQPPAAGDFALLNDLQTLGAELSLRALSRLAAADNPSATLADADAASKLLPTSTSVRSTRGSVLLASGGAEAGARELEAAAQLRGDAPRHNNLAMLALAKGDIDAAAKQVSFALTEAPDYAAAHLCLVSVHMARGERDLARAELDKAEELDRDMPALPLAWAEFFAASGDLAEASARASQAVALRPKSPEAHLVAARIDHEAGRYDEMRAHAQKVLELSPITDKERVKTLLRSLLGPTALAPGEVDTTDTTDTPQPTAAGGDVQLSAGSNNGPDTTQLAAPMGDPSLQLGSVPPKLQLGGGGGGKLKLDLSH